MPDLIALGLAAGAIVSRSRPAHGDICLAAAHRRAGERQVGYDARPLCVCLIVVRVPAIVAVFRPGRRAADTSAVAAPDEEPSFTNAVGYIPLSIAVEIPNRRWAYGPTAGELRPAIRCEGRQPGLSTGRVKRVQV